MKLIVGLGNPGQEYDRTRHNAGFDAVEILARRHAAGSMPKSRFHAVTLDAAIAGEKCLLMKPTTYMNRSGQAVGEALRFFKLDPSADLLVLVDDLALPVGTIRVRASGGPGGHNGLADIDQKLGTQDYPRLRIGIGAKPPQMNQADYVLSRFREEERGAYEASLKLAADAAERVVAEGVDAAMNVFNRRVGESAAGDW